MRIDCNKIFVFFIKLIFFILLGAIVFFVVGAIVESNNAEKVLSSISARNLFPERLCIPTCGDSWRAAMLPYRDYVDRRNELLEWSAVMVSISCCYSFVFWRFLLFRRFNYLLWLFRIMSGVIMDATIIVASFVLYYGLYTPAALKKEGCALPQMIVLIILFTRLIV